jgi:hypothetical protein
MASDSVFIKGEIFFSFPQCPDSSGAHTASYPMGTRALPQGKDNQSPPSSAKAKNGEAIHPFPLITS